MPQTERPGPFARHNTVRTWLPLAAVLLVAGCGSTVDELAGPTATPSPVTSSLPSPTPSPTKTTVITVTASATGSPQPVGSPSPSAAPSTLGPTATTTYLRDGDSGSTVELHVGQRLRVQLQQDTWDPPTSTVPAVVVRRSSSGGYPTTQPVDALFEAVATGTADLTAQSDAACFHTEPRCLMPVRTWIVHVVVS